MACGSPEVKIMSGLEFCDRYYLPAQALQCSLKVLVALEAQQKSVRTQGKITCVLASVTELALTSANPSV